MIVIHLAFKCENCSNYFFSIYVFPVLFTFLNKHLNILSAVLSQLEKYCFRNSWMSPISVPSRCGLSGCTLLYNLMKIQQPRRKHLTDLRIERHRSTRIYDCDLTPIDIHFPRLTEDTWRLTNEPPTTTVM